MSAAVVSAKTVIIGLQTIGWIWEMLRKWLVAVGGEGEGGIIDDSQVSGVGNCKEDDVIPYEMEVEEQIQDEELWLVQFEHIKFVVFVKHLPGDVQ